MLEEQEALDLHLTAFGHTYIIAKQVFEKHWLAKTMQECKYNQSRAAIRMGMSRGTLRAKLREHFQNEYFRDTE